MSWSKKNRLAIFLNVTFTILAAFILLIMANYLANKYYRRFDTTQEKLHQVSTQTKRLLATLNKEKPEKKIIIKTFFQENNPLFEKVRDLLEEYTLLSPHLEVEHIDPARDRSRAITVLKSLGKESTQVNDIIIQYRENSKNISGCFPKWNPHHRYI